MTDFRSIDLRLRALQEYVVQLRRLFAMGLRRVHGDPILQAALCRYLQVAIECVLDIGELIIAGEGWPRPGTNREVILLLGRKAVLARGFAERFSAAAGLRNILVHDYVEVDLGLIFRNKDRLRDFDAFARSIARFLRRKRR